MPRDRIDHIEDFTSRYACCTPGVIDACVRAVAAEGSLEGVIPDWSALQVALVARDALEGFELGSSISDHILRRDVAARDWALCVLAEARFFAVQMHQERSDSARQTAALDLVWAALEDVASSADRSPVLWYEDIYFDAAQSLVRRVAGGGEGPARPRAWRATHRPTRSTSCVMRCAWTSTRFLTRRTTISRTSSFRRSRRRA